MSGHTPGPWTAVPRRLNKIAVLHAIRNVPGASTLTVAEVNVRDSWLDEQTANARLIASAPELLEALQMLEREMVESGNARSVDYGWKPAIEKTRAAIAKATGGQP